MVETRFLRLNLGRPNSTGCCVGLALPFGYPSTSLRASAQGPRSRRVSLPQPNLQYNELLGVPGFRNRVSHQNFDINSKVILETRFLR